MFSEQKWIGVKNQIYIFDKLYWNISQFLQTFKFCQSPLNFEYVNHRSHHFSCAPFSSIWQQKIYLHLLCIISSTEVSICDWIWLEILSFTIRTHNLFITATLFLCFQMNFLVFLAFAHTAVSRLGGIYCRITNDHGRIAKIGFHWFHSK